MRLNSTRDRAARGARHRPDPCAALRLGLGRAPRPGASPLHLTGDQEATATCAPPTVCGDPDASAKAVVIVLPRKDVVLLRDEVARYRRHGRRGAHPPGGRRRGRPGRRPLVRRHVRRHGPLSRLRSGTRVHGRHRGQPIGLLPEHPQHGLSAWCGAGPARLTPSSAERGRPSSADPAPRRAASLGPAHGRARSSPDSRDARLVLRAVDSNPRDERGSRKRTFLGDDMTHVTPTGGDDGATAQSAEPTQAEIDAWAAEEGAPRGVAQGPHARGARRVRERLRHRRLADTFDEGEQ